MQHDELDQTIVTPLYQQLKETLTAKIESGEYSHGVCIPSEYELSVRYGISRITVRKAVASLVEEGLLVKRQGKGTFVEKPKLERKIIEFLSFSTACEYNGVRPGAKLLRRILREPTETEARELKLPNDDQLTHIQRLRSADGEPLLVENNFFSFSAYPYLMQEDLENQSLYDVLRSRGVHMTNAKKILEMSLASDADAKQLGIRPNSPLFKLKGIVFDDKAEPIHLSLQLIRADRYKFVF